MAPSLRQHMFCHPTEHELTTGVHRQSHIYGVERTTMWSDYLGSETAPVDDPALDTSADDAAGGADWAYWSNQADESALDDTNEANSYLSSAQADIATGWDPTADLSDAGSDLSIASDDELTAANDSATAADDFSSGSDVTAGGGDVWDPALDA